MTSFFPKSPLRYFIIDDVINDIKNIHGKEYELKIIDISDSERVAYASKICYTINIVIVGVFSVVDLHSFESVQKQWIPEIKEHCPTTPVILVGNKTDFREKCNENATTEMGLRVRSTP